MDSELVPPLRVLQASDTQFSMTQSTSITHLPPEIIEAILSVSLLTTVSAFSQTCKAYHRLIYQPIDNHLWRTLFLNQQDYDDPRLALGEDALIPWDTLLQRWTAMGKLLRVHAPRFTSEVLKALLEMVEYARPASRPSSFDSRNLQYLQAVLWSSGFFNQDVHSSGQHESDYGAEWSHMLSRLKLYAGLEAVLSSASRRLRARSFVYDLRNYHKHNCFGPFISDGSGRVNWKHLYAIQEVIAMNITDFVEGDHPGLPMTMKHIQPQTIPRSAGTDIRDWAGVEGKWQVIFCFCDHRDLLAFNRLNAFHDTPDPSVFQDDHFEEALRFLEFELSMVDIEETPAASPFRQARPTLHFVGRVSGNARVKGRVYMTPDGQVRWSFVSGEPGQTIWSTEAVQVGGVASAFGALGAWTTVFHEVDDPVGPMWLWKLSD